MEPCRQNWQRLHFFDLHQSNKIIFRYLAKLSQGKRLMDFEQVKKVLEVTDVRIRGFGSIDSLTSYKINEAIFKFQPFQRLVIAHHSQVALTHLKEQTIPIANSLEQLIATAINLNYAEFGKFAQPSIDKPT